MRSVMKDGEESHLFTIGNEDSPLIHMKFDDFHVHHIYSTVSNHESAIPKAGDDPVAVVLLYFPKMHTNDFDFY